MLKQPEPSEAQHPTAWSDVRVEQLLDWFFARELPAPLQAPPSPPAVRLPVEVNAVRRTVRPVHRWLLPMCVTALLGTVWVVGQSSFTRRQFASTAPARIVELETASLPVLIDRISFAGTHDRFEQRSELRWTSESCFEPATGDWVEWSAPELVIDVETVAGLEGAVQ